MERRLLTHCLPAIKKATLTLLESTLTYNDGMVQLSCCLIDCNKVISVPRLVIFESTWPTPCLELEQMPLACVAGAFLSIRSCSSLDSMNRGVSQGPKYKLTYLKSFQLAVFTLASLVGQNINVLGFHLRL